MPTRIRSRTLRCLGLAFVASRALFFALWVWREMGIRAARENDAWRIAEIERLRTDNAQLAARAAHTIELTGTTASARVFLEPERRRAVVYFQNLPLNAADKSYQLWIIRADQTKPVSAGVFDATKDGSAAVSLEMFVIADIDSKIPSVFQ